MRFLWPNRLNPSPGVLTRFGRVLHWTGVAMGVGFCLMWVITSTTMAAYPYTQWSYIAVGVLGGFFSAMAGRALRYIFSGE